LEERLAVFFPKPRTGKMRKLRRKLRRIRRLLGEWRNCDVLLKLLAPESDTDENPATQDAWKLMHDYLVEKRSHEIRRSRSKIEKYNRSAPGEAIDKMLQSHSSHDSTELLQRVHAAQSAARQKWLSTLMRAEQSAAVDDVHKFRIATKRFRYRTELVHEAGDDQTSILDALKKLQDLLGSWNDRQTLQRAIAEALANPKLLLRQPLAARILLQHLEESQLGESKTAQEIIRFARDNQSLPKEEAPSSESRSLDQEVG
jgi:CHAD domain-containing protein